MLTMTLSLALSVLTSSTMPMKLVKGPSMTRTLSPIRKRTLGFGLPLSLGPAADKTRDLRRLPDDVPGLVVQLHLDENVSREYLPVRNLPLALLQLNDLLGRNHDLRNLVSPAEGGHPLEQAFLDFVLESGVGMDHIQTVFNGSIYVVHFLLNPLYTLTLAHDGPDQADQDDIDDAEKESDDKGQNNHHRRSGYCLLPCGPADLLEFNVYFPKKALCLF